MVPLSPASKHAPPALPGHILPRECGPSRMAASRPRGGERLRRGRVWRSVAGDVELPARSHAPVGTRARVVASKVGGEITIRKASNLQLPSNDPEAIEQVDLEEIHAANFVDIPADPIDTDFKSSQTRSRSGVGKVGDFGDVQRRGAGRSASATHAASANADSIFDRRILASFKVRATARVVEGSEPLVRDGQGQLSNIGAAS